MNLIPDVTNSWVELTLEKGLRKRECPRTYKHMVKLTFNQCGTLARIITYHHAPQPTSTTTHSSDTNMLIGVMVGSDTKCYKLMGRTHP